MAMSESSPAPPYGSVANKDNTHQGECESDETETNEDCQGEIDPADLEDGEILDDSDGESKGRQKVAATEEAMVNLNNVMMNNPISSDSASRKKKKKRSKRPPSASNETAPKKRKKYVDHDEVDGEEPFFERTSEAPISRTRDGSKRHRDNSFVPSRRSEKNSGSFEEEIALEERRHLKQGTKLPVHQRLGDRTSNRAKGRGLRTMGMAGKRGGLNSRPPLRKREPRPKPVCKFYMDGNCNKGAVCPFSHDMTPFKKKDLCKFYLNGYCAKEEVCLFMHEDFPCKFFHTGAVCYADTECRFSHKPLDDETQQLLARYLDSCHNYPKPDRRRDRSPPRMDRGEWVPPHHDYPPHHHLNNNHMNEGMMNNNFNPQQQQQQQPRPSLLGSPPRHIKEQAPEWQLDLMMNMQENSPPHMNRPVFYMDTLGESPQHGPPQRGHLPPFGPHLPPHMMEMRDMEPFQMGGPFPQPPICGDLTPTQGGATPIPTDDEAEGDVDEKLVFPSQKTQFFSVPKRVPDPEEKISAVISAIRAETEFNRTPPQLEVERSLSPTSRPDNDQPPDLMAGSPEESPTVVKEEGLAEDSAKEEKTESVIAAESAEESPSVSEENTNVIPSHLPRKQRELFMRIQQHQRLAKLKAAGEGGTDNPEDQPEEMLEEDSMEVIKEEVKAAESEKLEVNEKVEKLLEVKEEEEEEDEEDETEEEPKAKWYSSDEDDDDNGDQPLTDVLKRLQQMPPPVARPPAAASTAKAAPSIDIAKMLSSIREQATLQSGGGGVSAGIKSDFWQNILSATAPPPCLPETDSKQPKRDPRSRNGTPKQPLLPSVATHQNAKTPIGRTLSARDPRLSRSVSKPEGETVPMIAKPKAPLLVPPPVKEEKIWVKEEKVWEMGSKDRKSCHSYRLHTVTVLPLNYSSYLFATQNDTRLLEDPRLKKLLTSQTSPRPATTLPFPPELQLYLEQGESKIKQQSPPAQVTPLSPQLPSRAVNLILGNASSSSSSSNSSSSSGGSSSSGATVQKIDPRLKRNPPPSAQSPVHTGGMTPPHHPIMDMPLHLHSGGFTPPHPVNHLMMDIPNPLIMGFQPNKPHMNPIMDINHPHLLPNPMIPNPMIPKPMIPNHMMHHSHMPRGFIDPRFTRMQQPMNRGRGRGLPPRPHMPPSKIQRSNKNITKVLPETKNDEPPKSEVNDKKIQRKTKMDYTSPLSAYDEGDASESAGYNRRPQPKPRTITSSPTTVTTLNPVVGVQAVIPSSASKTDSVPEIMGIQSEDINAASLREVFKTIDPTASPFC